MNAELNKLFLEEFNIAYEKLNFLKRKAGFDYYGTRDKMRLIKNRRQDYDIKCPSIKDYGDLMKLIGYMEYVAKH